MEKSSVLWLVPKETNKSQCLHIILIKKTKEIIEIIVSEYQCIYGHRMSNLLLQMYKTYNNNINNNTNKMKENIITLELIEDEEYDIIPTLYYIHSESLNVIFSECSALTLAKTAHFLQINHLCLYIIEEASLTLSYSLNLSHEIGMLRISIWDAIAILHLLGDTHNLLTHVRLNEWYER